MGITESGSKSSSADSYTFEPNWILSKYIWFASIGLSILFIPCAITGKVADSNVINALLGILLGQTIFIVWLFTAIFSITHKRVEIDDAQIVFYPLWTSNQFHIKWDDIESMQLSTKSNTLRFRTKEPRKTNTNLSLMFYSFKNQSEIKRVTGNHLVLRGRELETKYF